MTSKADICTLLWPESKLGKDKFSGSGGIGSTQQEEIREGNNLNSWLVGWNTHGLTVILACELKGGISFAEAQHRLAEIKKNLAGVPHAPGMSDYKSLKLLGLVRRDVGGGGGGCGGCAMNACVSSPSSAVPGSDQFGVRQMRQTSDLWLELLDGPVLGELWCCGFRVQPCQLHIVRCDARRHYATHPQVHSVCDLFGAAGIAQIRKGKAPFCLPGAKSNLEGVLLPDVMREESAPVLKPAQPHGKKDELVEAHRMGSGSFLEHSTSNRKDSLEGSLNEDSFFRNEVDYSGSFELSMSAMPEAIQRVHAPPPPPGVPPRLSFAITARFSELDTLVEMARQSLNVQLVANGHPPVTDVSALDDLAQSSACGPAAGEPEGEGCAAGATDATGSGGSSSSVTADGRCQRVPAVVETLVGAAQAGFILLVRVLQPLRRFSYTAEIVELRVRFLINLCSQIRGESHSCGMHPVAPHRTSGSSRGCAYCCLNVLSNMLMDTALGLLLGFFIRVGGPPIYSKAQLITRHFLAEMHLSYLDWFRGWPAGMKLNEDLNAVMCAVAQDVVTMWDLAMRGLRNGDDSLEYVWLTPSYNLLTVVGAFGASMIASLVADIAGLVSLHLRFLYHVFLVPYRLEKCLLVGLFQQFRGKTYNPLRRRVDTHTFDNDQMFAATIIFVVAAFLFPTVVVYYLYFSFVRMSVWLVQELLNSLAHLAVFIPAFPVGYWLLFRQRMGGSVVLSPPVVTMSRRHQVGSEGSAQEVVSQTVEMEVQSRPQGVGYSGGDFGVVLRLVFAPFHPATVLSVFFNGRIAATDAIEQLIPHLLINSADPPCTLLSAGS